MVGKLADGANWWPAADVTGLATWHINADEPRSMDYNQEYNPKPLYQPDPFRSSDHDPVLIGIRNWKSPLIVAFRSEKVAFP